MMSGKALSFDQGSEERLKEMRLFIKYQTNENMSSALVE